MPKQTQTSWVDLVEWDPMTQSGFVVVRAFLERDVVKLDGDKILVEQLARGLDPFTLTDGLAFLEKMVRSFRNPYLLATDIQTGVMPKDFGLVSMNLVSVK